MIPFKNIIKSHIFYILFGYTLFYLILIINYQFITPKLHQFSHHQITKEERSYIYSAAFRPAQSELSIIQVNDANILQETKLQNSDIEYLKNALQSVYPTQISIQNSIFILLTPKYIKAENKVISYLITQMKNNANCNITDVNIIKSLAYEIEVKVVHRETQKMLNENNFSLLRQDWNNCIQDLQLYQLEEEKQLEDLYDYAIKNDWNIVKNKQLSTNDQDQQSTKEFIKEQTKFNSDEPNYQVFAIELTNPENLNLLGIYDICVNFRSCPIIQSSLQAVVTLNFNVENVNKLNKPKISQQQILQKFKIKNENIITYQSNGQHIIEMNQLQQLNDFSYHQNLTSSLPLKKSTIIEQYDEEFSVTSDDQAVPSNQASQKREIQVESDINEFIRKLFGNNQRDDLTTIEIQSSKGSKTIIDSTDDSIQVNGKQAITRYNDQNIIQNQIRIFSLNIITGACVLYFTKNSAIQNSVYNPDNGVHVFTDCITFSSNIQYFQVKFVQSKDQIDVYCNNQFLGNYKYENLFIKFCVKGTEIKLY